MPSNVRASNAIDGAEMRVEDVAADVEILPEPCPPRRFLAEHVAHPFAARPSALSSRIGKLWLLSARITNALAPRRGRVPVKSGSSKLSARAVKPRAFKVAGGDLHRATCAGAGVAPEDRGRRDAQKHQRAGHPLGRSPDQGRHRHRPLPNRS